MHAYMQAFIWTCAWCWFAHLMWYSACAAAQASKHIVLRLEVCVSTVAEFSWGLVVLIIPVALFMMFTENGPATWASTSESFRTCATDFVAHQVLGSAPVCVQNLVDFLAASFNATSTENTAAAARAPVPVTPGTVEGANPSTPPRKGAAAPVAPTGNTQNMHPAKRTRC